MSLTKQFGNVLSATQLKEAETMTKGAAQVRSSELRNAAYAPNVTPTEQKTLLAQARAFRQISEGYSKG